MASRESCHVAPQARGLVSAASISLITLILLSLAWELWLAPLRPGGSWLVLKSLPLLGAVFGVLHGRRYTYQWSSMLILAYMAEGIVRIMSDAGFSRALAAIELALALAFFVSTVWYARITGRHPSARKAP